MTLLMAHLDLAGDQRNDPSFLRRLFDLSFREFITPAVSRVVFVIFNVLVLLFAILVFIQLARSTPNALGIILGAIGIILGALLIIMIFRMVLESKLVLFQIEKNTRPSARR